MVAGREQNGADRIDADLEGALSNSPNDWTSPDSCVFRRRAKFSRSLLPLGAK